MIALAFLFFAHLASAGLSGSSDEHTLCLGFDIAKVQERERIENDGLLRAQKVHRVYMPDTTRIMTEDNSYLKAAQMARSNVCKYLSDLGTALAGSAPKDLSNVKACTAVSNERDLVSEALTQIKRARQQIDVIYPPLKKQDTALFAEHTSVLRKLQNLAGSDMEFLKPEARSIYAESNGNIVGPIVTGIATELAQLTARENDLLARWVELNNRSAKCDAVPSTVTKPALAKPATGKPLNLVPKTK